MHLQLQGQLQSLGRKGSGIQLDILTGIISHDYSKKPRQLMKFQYYRLGFILFNVSCLKK